MYRGDRQHRLAALANRAHALAASAGRGVMHVVTLEVRGRRTGRRLSFPVVVADYDGERHHVAMLGENANWVRNVRAAKGQAVQRDGRREAVRLEEVNASARAPILQRYCASRREPALASSSTPRAPLEEFERIAPQHPVFRVRTDSFQRE